MRRAQNTRVLLMLILAGAFCCRSLRAQNAGTNSHSPTFDYDTRTYPELTNAIQQVQQRLDVAEKMSGNNNTNVADLISDLAGLYDNLGNYAQAASLCERCLVIREKLLGEQNLQVADILDDLAWEYREMGDYERALPLFQQSLTITEELVGHDNFDVATTMANIADVYRLEENYPQALPLCQRALEIREKELGKDHPDVSDSLVSLAKIYRGLGDDLKALPPCQRSIDICEKQMGHDQPLVTDGLFLLGQIQVDLGNYSDAWATFHRLLAIDEKFSGPEHPDTLEVLEQEAELFEKQNDLERSLDTFIDLFGRQRRYFLGQILALPDSDALRSIQNSFESVEVFHSACAEGSAEDLDDASVAGATELALNKALLEEVRAAQAAFEADPRTATKLLRDEYRSRQFEWEHLEQSRLTKTQLETKRRELQNELIQIESKLTERVGLVAQAVRERSLTLIDIARNLPSQSVLVDIIQYRRHDFAARTNQWREQRYAAYLTFPLMAGSTNARVERVDLGEAAPINESVAVICKRMSAGQFEAKDLAGALEKLSELTYFPLARYLTNSTHLILCPDGQLTRVPFEMLPVGDKFLLEEKTVSYVTSGREVARFATSAANVRNSKSVVMGNPDFNFDLVGARPKSPAVQLAGGPLEPRSLTRDYNGLMFQPLPGAEAEARSVAKLLGDNAVLYLGVDAREAKLKAVHSPRVLHLATHGFYFPDQDLNSRNSSAKLGPTRQLPYAKWRNWENPMVRCGIALAGANHAVQITNALAEDGLLTALDASLLNLQGTELVVLSTCDSGTGEVKIGEGMMSLRRAFLIAGAQSVLASHWDISDKATTQLITEFMLRWQSGESRATAWRDAQLTLLHSKDFSNPYFWAAFTLTGQWR